MTGVPQNNYESFQILQYDEGQFYRKHHDSSQQNAKKPAGHRILTFFLYLNDVEGVCIICLCVFITCFLIIDVTSLIHNDSLSFGMTFCVEGGETRFTNLDISVKPKKVCRV